MEGEADVGQRKEKNDQTGAVGLQRDTPGKTCIALLGPVAAQQILTGKGSRELPDNCRSTWHLPALVL